jgi:D-alanyl-D-alanine carboxypeptidase
MIGTTLVTLLSLGFSASLPSSGAPSIALDRAQRAAVDDAVQATMSRAHIPGVSLAIFQDGRLLYAHGYGYRDVAAQTRVDPQTYFAIGSITKQFTSTCIALLAQDGALHFDDTLSHYLPDAPHASEITIWQLMTQMSGLPDYLGQPGVQPYLYSQTVRPDALYGLVAGKPLHFPPGTKFEYSNTNYVLLGALIEHVSGEPYAVFLRKRLLDQTPFAGVSFGKPTSDNLSLGYDNSEKNTVLPTFSSSVAFSAGALYARASDIARWDDAFFAGRILSAQAVTQLTTPPTPLADPSDTYAAGWMRSTVDGHAQIWHNGGLPGFGALNAYFPEQKLAVVALGNSETFSQAAIMRDVFRAIVPPTPEQRAAEAQSAPGEDPAITARARALYAQLVAGKLDRSQFTSQANAAFTDSVVQHVGSQFAALGAPTAFVFVSTLSLPGRTAYVYRVLTPGMNLVMTLTLDGSGTIAGVLFKPGD